MEWDDVVWRCECCGCSVCALAAEGMSRIDSRSMFEG